jgi:P4 family phage/plasmid primase-like protien
MSTIIATYAYRDEAGGTLFEVLRKDPKAFTQRIPTAGGEYEYKLNGVRRVPFTLPELLSDIRNGETICVVEGERDVLSLREAGVAATTFAMGADFKWTDESARYFTGAKRVIVICDNDDPGRTYGHRNAALLAKTFPEMDVRVIDTLPGVPEKGDATDWIAGGGTKEVLMALATVAPRASKPRTRAGTVVEPVALPIMEEWRELAHQIADESTVPELTAGGDRRENGSRSMRCPLDGHTTGEDIKPSAWIGAEGSSYIVGCDKHGHFLLLPFLIESGWASDKPDARQKLRDLGYTLPASPAKQVTASLDEGGMRRAVNALLSATNDKANGRWFAALYAAKLRYNSDTDKWYAWDGKRWAKCTDTAIERYAKAASDEMATQAVSMGLDDETRQQLLRRASDCSNVKRWNAMLRSARSESDLECGVDDFNADPWLLNCENGTLDLRTGEVRPHSQADFITALVPVDFDPSVRSALWERTLEQVFADPSGEGYVPNLDTINFFQRAIGYSLTGNTSEECFFILYGDGRNGKGTTMEPCQALLAELAEVASFNMFLDDHRPSKDGATPGMSSLVGARMVVASEAKRGAAFDEAVVKALTGNDRIKTRELYSKPFEFKPQFKIWLMTNHLPPVSASDYAFWERCKTIPYNRKFEVADRDQTLKSRLLNDLQGILTWAVEGCFAWQAAAKAANGKGLGTCAAVEESTRAYQADNNHLMRWLESACVIEEGAECVKIQLNESYNAWVSDRENGIDRDQRMNPTELGRALATAGFVLKMPSQKKRLGLRLQTANEWAERHVAARPGSAF